MYDPTLSRDIDRLRFDLDDTAGPMVGSDPDDPEVQAQLAAELVPDETYQGQLSHNGNDYDKALYALAKFMMLHYANEPQRMNVAGKQEADWSARFSAWRDIVSRASASVELAADMYANGMRSTRVRRPSNPDRGEYTLDRRPL